MRFCIWGELLVIGMMVCGLVCGVNYWYDGMRLGMWGKVLVIGLMVCSLVCGVNYWLLVSWYAAWYVG